MYFNKRSYEGVSWESVNRDKFDPFNQLVTLSVIPLRGAHCNLLQAVFFNDGFLILITFKNLHLLVMTREQKIVLFVSQLSLYFFVHFKSYLEIKAVLMLFEIFFEVFSRQ
jgi:hypothetical protein